MVSITFPWSNGDILFGGDLNAAQFGGLGAGSIFQTTGSAVLSGGTLYTYESVFIGTGASLVVDSNTNGSPLYILCNQDFTVNGIIDLRGAGLEEGAGGGGGAAGGSGGAGGNGLYIEVGGDFSVTGSVDIRGNVGLDGENGNGTSTAGGSGASYVYFDLFGGTGGSGAGTGAGDGAGGGGASSWGSGTVGEGSPTTPAGTTYRRWALIDELFNFKFVTPGPGGGGGAGGQGVTASGGGGGGGAGGVGWIRVAGTVATGGEILFVGGAGGSGPGAVAGDGGEGGSGNLVIENISYPW